MKARRSIISKAVQAANRKTAVNRRALVAGFIRAYFARVPIEDLAARKPADLAGAALAHLELVESWKRSPRALHAFNPEQDSDGWDSDHTVVMIVMDDSPFLIASVTMELNRHGFVNHLLVHPILKMKRDRRGRIVDIRASGDAGGDGKLTSFIFAEVNRETDPERLRALEQALHRVLDDVRAAVKDWRQVMARVAEMDAELEKTPPPLDRRVVQESVQFLRWLRDDHFTFLGYRDYDLIRSGAGGVSLRVVPGTGLGILRERRSSRRSSSFDKLPAQLKRQAQEKTLLTLTKSNTRSTVHRPVYLDYVGIKRYGKGGKVTGERRMLGLYTSAAYMINPRDIPLVGRKIETVVRRSGLMPGSHAGKVLQNVLDTLPRDELLQAGEEDLAATAMGIVDLQERQRVRVFIRRDRFERFCACLVFVPRERFHSNLRRRIQEILARALNGSDVDFETSISQSVYAQLYLTVHTTPGRIPAYDIAKVEAEIATAARTWTDGLQQDLVRSYGEEWGNDLLRRYGDAFPAAYQDEHTPAQAVADLRRAEAAVAAEALQLVLYRKEGTPADHVNFRIYNPGGSVHLSSALPILENMGLFVISQDPCELNLEGHKVWVHDFGMRHRAGRGIDPAAVKDRFQEAFAAIWAGAVEGDSFNQLVLGAGLNAREITLLRAYSKYMRQIGSAFSQAYIQDTVNRHGDIAGLLVELFRARFDPDAATGRERRVNALEARIVKLLDAVQSLDEDRILRRYFQLIRATLRTNYFLPLPDGHPREYVSFKLASRTIPDLDPPHPLYEIFVYSPKVEGVHLRGGKVARGGLRWSDRREDFRTEVLGLMKAQTVKNAVIVPVGAKGGFYVKNPPQGDRAAVLAEGIACYKTFIRGLLDITDNRVGGKIVTPARVVRYDEDDPYLVVAADKGTAAFSDIANSVSAEYGFWLGDAFASGGSAGYDHKAMAITAKGAWESVRHHFQKLGQDPQETDFTVIGIGDMAGDVFGNGMLMSPHIKLIGAFNHQHVFLDPDPDPKKSFAERQRLFNLPGSSWDDYKKNLISAGGGVFPRSAKSIRLSPQVQRALDVTQESANPSELIRMILRAPVDLLWNGGIGTYVKADDEPHSAAGDRGNDNLRVNASELRCRIVGEGGNLGFTQRARVQYAQKGGCLNADWIDNSGGVHCSDREVNIKILLNAIMAEGDLALADRNRLLKGMTNEVAQLVIQDNYRQARAITAAELESPRRPGWYGELLLSLDGFEGFVRDREQLPDAAAMEKRRTQKQGLARPEIAVVVPFTKMALYQDILRSDLPDEPYMGALLARYFPSALRKRFGDRIGSHQLRREIIATVLTNSMVNRAGITFGHRLADETGASTAEITRAFLVARDVFDVRSMWVDIDRLDFKVPVAGQMQLVFETQHLLRHAARWFLRHGSYLRDVSGTVERFATGVRAVQSMAGRLPGLDEWGFLRGLQNSLIEAGVAKPLARRFAALRMLINALEITHLAIQVRLPPEAAARVYFLLGEKLCIHIAHAFANTLTTDTAWQDRARTDQAQDLLTLQGELAAGVLAGRGRKQKPEARIDAWLAERQEALHRYEEVLEDLRRAPQVELAMLNVMTAKLRNLRSGAG